MKKDEIVNLQERVGTKPDGIWGPKSKKACKDHLKKLMPSPNPWPMPDEESMIEFYGHPQDNSVIVGVKAPDWLKLYNTVTPMQKIWCHHKVAQSLLRALEAAHAVCPEEVSRFYGTHVDRPPRGATSGWSKHAFGAAIDLDADANRNHDRWPQESSMPIQVMEEFAKEGWLAAGAFWGRDAMHFQATL